MEVSRLKRLTLFHLFSAKPMKTLALPFWGWLLLLFITSSATSAQSLANTFAASSNHSVSIHPDGTLWAWGLNFEGQLGDGSTTGRTQPTQVLLPSSSGSLDPHNARWAQVATGSAHTLALTIDGELYAWGSNSDGQLGDGSTANHHTPVKVALPADARQLRWARIAAGTSHTLALTTDGRLWAWGNNRHGQFGNGTSISANRPMPIALPNGAVATQLSAGNQHSLVLTTDGELYAWGSNRYGQLGNGSTMPSLSPVAVTAIRGRASRWAQVSAGRYHTLAVTTDGRLYSWGSNEFGQLSGNASIERSSPQLVSLPTSARHQAWAQVSAGAAHSFALTTDGQLYTWGLNLDGQLGDGSTKRRLYPVSVAMPQGTMASWVRVAAGPYHSLALADDGQLYTWGNNHHGQLGDGSTTNHQVPAGNGQALISPELPSNHAPSTSQLPSSAEEAWGLNDTQQFGLEASQALSFRH
jgi:alpha-tubulin suppressor-like RCC1 family protein